MGSGKAGQDVHTEEVECSGNVELGCRVWHMCNLSSPSHGCMSKMSVWNQGNSWNHFLLRGSLDTYVACFVTYLQNHSLNSF